MHVSRLVADGPYRYVRNPLYLGTILLAVGYASMASRLGALVLIVGNVLFAARLIGLEQATLVETQGESYRAYRRALSQR